MSVGDSIAISSEVIGRCMTFAHDPNCRSREQPLKLCGRVSEIQIFDAG
jgi:hypothetical protein